VIRGTIETTEEDRVADGMTGDEVFEILKEIIVDALRVSAEEVQRDSNFFVDLDAESIDFVDIRFRIEEKFGFRIEQAEFAKSLGSGEQFDVQKTFTVDRLVTFVVEQLVIRDSQ
jgi:acyl carrier protein